MEHMGKQLPPRASKTPEKRKKRKLLIILLVLVIVLTTLFAFRKQVAVLIFDLFFEKNVKEILHQSYEELEEGSEEVVEETRAVLPDKPFSVLLLGTDQREDEVARTDSIIYAVFRPTDNRILLVSIPRDAKVQIAGRNSHTKINAAYAFGGAKMSVETVQALFEQPVHYYGVLNFQGLIRIVDTLGGVELDIKETIVNRHKNHEKFTIEANKPIYDGVESLNYVRYREDSDFNRTARQRLFIQAMMNQMKKVSNLGKLDDVLQIVAENLATNMEPDFIIQMVKQLYVERAVPSVSSHMLQGRDSMIDGTYYYLLDEPDLKHVQQLNATWLDPAASQQELDLPLSGD